MIIEAIIGLTIGAIAAASKKPAAKGTALPAKSPFPARAVEAATPGGPMVSQTVSPADGVTPAQAALIATGPAQAAAAQAASAATYAPAATFLPAVTRPGVPAAVVMPTPAQAQEALFAAQRAAVAPGNAAAEASRQAANARAAEAERNIIAQRSMLTADQARAQEEWAAYQKRLADTKARDEATIAAARAAGIIAQREQEARAAAARAAFDKQVADYMAANTARAAEVAAKAAADRARIAAETARQTDPATWVERHEAGIAPLVAQILANQPNLSAAGRERLKAEAIYGFATQAKQSACSVSAPLCSVATAYVQRCLDNLNAAKQAEANEQAAAAAAKAAETARAVAASKAAQAAAQQTITDRYYANSPTAVPASVVTEVQRAYDAALRTGQNANTMGALLTALTKAYDTAVAQLRWHFGTAPVPPAIQGWLNTLAQNAQNVRTELSRGLSPFSPIPPRLLTPLPAPPSVAGLAGFSGFNSSPAQRRRTLLRQIRGY